MFLWYHPLETYFEDHLQREEYIMLTGIDHIIIGVNNLAEAARIFNDRLGLAVSGGGIHPTGGTENRIIVIGDTYIELIAVRKAEEAQQSMLDRLARGNGYLNFVLSSNDIEADTAAMRERGVAVIGPTPGRLNAANGQYRAWSRSDVERPDLTQHYPFLIQHDSTGEERRHRLAGWTTPPQHPLGASKVLSATIAVENLGEAARRFQHIYGLPHSEPFTGEADAWDALLVSFPLPPNGQSFELAAPLPEAIDAARNGAHLPQPGALADYLRSFGESLCRVTLAVENLAASRRYLDERGVTYTYTENTGNEHPVLWIHPEEACGAAIVLHEFTPDLPPDNPLEG
jgi:catechol 2,3-dioxygenase-like lactoylglutathione lyase family enzyme